MLTIAQRQQRTNFGRTIHGSVGKHIHRPYLPTTITLGSSTFTATAAYEAQQASIKAAPTASTWPGLKGLTLASKTPGSATLTGATNTAATRVAAPAYFSPSAIKFSDGYTFAYPNNTDLAIGATNDLIVEAVYKASLPTTGGVSSPLVGRYSLNVAGWILRINAAGVPRFSWETGSSISGDFSIADNHYHHTIVFYVRGGTSYMITDGYAVSSFDTTVDTDTDAGNTAKFEIGGYDSQESTVNGHILGNQTVSRATVFIGDIPGQPSQAQVVKCALDRFKNLGIKH